ncbi:hypothetical protein SUGI_0972540 [Cryptomeria japonica]|nr:hypothetical protein SUGI_0972540 [Cryptomeria japonica]
MPSIFQHSYVVKIVHCRCWSKQLVIAKDGQRADILCFRISLSHRFLNGTVHYRELHEIVEVAAKKLEEEAGPMNRVNHKMTRGIVSRLYSGLEVHKLCAMGIEEVDVMFSWVSQASTNVYIRDNALHGIEFVRQVIWFLLLQKLNLMISHPHLLLHVFKQIHTDSTNSSDKNKEKELPKSDHENHSKVTLLEETCNDNEVSMPS